MSSSFALESANFSRSALTTIDDYERACRARRDLSGNGPIAPLSLQPRLADAVFTAREAITIEDTSREPLSIFSPSTQLAFDSRHLQLALLVGSPDPSTLDV